MFSLFAILAAAAAPVSEEEAVLKVVDQFFEGYYAKDLDLMRSTLTEDAAGRSARPGPDGKMRVSPDAPVAELLQRMESYPDIVEVYWDAEVKIDGALAQFWAPYVLEVGGKRIHCGIDAFTLVKQEGAWKLHSLDYTADPDGCDRYGYTLEREGMRPASLVSKLSGN
ncbi:MAG: hypothetical protein AAF830_16210 [Pseudomonadota bacterium]